MTAVMTRIGMRARIGPMMGMSSESARVTAKSSA